MEMCWTQGAAPGWTGGVMESCRSANWKILASVWPWSWQRSRKKTKERNLRRCSCGRQLVEPVWKNDFGNRPPILDKTVDTNPLSPEQCWFGVACWAHCHLNCRLKMENVCCNIVRGKGCNWHFISWCAGFTQGISWESSFFEHVSTGFV